MEIILRIPDEANLLEVDWRNLSRSHQEGATVTHPYDGEIIDLTNEEKQARHLHIGELVCPAVKDAVLEALHGNLRGRLVKIWKLAKPQRRQS